METTICAECVDDFFLKKIIDQSYGIHKCSICEETCNAITVNELGELLEPIMREHWECGPSVKKFGDNDDEWWEQEGDPMSSIVQEILGQYFEFEDGIVNAVCYAEAGWAWDGDSSYWDTTSNYVKKKVQSRYFTKWQYALEELKFERRFFSPVTKELFDKLFDDVDLLKVGDGTSHLPVVRKLSVGSKIFRARVCNARSRLKEIYDDPLKLIGPPPREVARAGRMNAEGMVVLYGSREKHTCLAEMRPAIGSDLIVIALKTTQSLRVLDFHRLERAWGGRTLSYLQPDFGERLEKRQFLRHLHRLISQPIVPGRESEYLITQALTEYLAYIHEKPFDGVLFASSQRAKGTNVVLFKDSSSLNVSVEANFRVSYVADSIAIFKTESVNYKHRRVQVSFDQNGEVFVNDSTEFDLDSDDE
jgi:RES domain